MNTDEPTIVITGALRAGGIYDAAGHRLIKLQYYDLKRNWRKVKRHLNDPKLSAILVRNFNKFTMGSWGRPFQRGHLPFDFESVDWYADHRGRMPSFWRYVRHGACHWLVNFALRLAQLVMPNRDWRIITSDQHSTVWDGHDTLFEFNFQAFGIPPDECFSLAYGRELKPGRSLRVYLAPPY